MIEFFLFTILLVVMFAILVGLNHIESTKKTGVHRIEYIDRKLVIDDFWVVAAFRARSLNCEVFEYLNNNQEREIPVDELEKHVFKGRIVVFSKIVDSLGVRGDLKKILFSLNTDSITYHPKKINSQNAVRVN